MSTFPVETLLSGALPEHEFPDGGFLEGSFPGDAVPQYASPDDLLFPRGWSHTGWSPSALPANPSFVDAPHTVPPVTATDAAGSVLPQRMRSRQAPENDAAPPITRYLSYSELGPVASLGRLVEDPGSHAAWRPPVPGVWVPPVGPDILARVIAGLERIGMRTDLRREEVVGFQEDD